MKTLSSILFILIFSLSGMGGHKPAVVSNCLSGYQIAFGFGETITLNKLAFGTIHGSTFQEGTQIYNNSYTEAIQAPELQKFFIQIADLSPYVGTYHNVSVMMDESGFHFYVDAVQVGLFNDFSKICK